MDYQKVLNHLDQGIFGLETEKQELVTFLKIREISGGEYDPIPCLVGPAGVGKRSLVAALAAATGRKYLPVRIDLRDAMNRAPVYGKSKIGEVVGRVLHLLDVNRDRDAIVLLDGIEHISPSFQNNAAMGFKEVLKVSEDYALRVKHIQSPLDFSRVLFFATAQDLGMVSPEIVAELEIIPVPGYSDEEKIRIARGWIVPREAADSGLGPRIRIGDDVLHTLIRRYTNEIGVIQLARLIRRLFRRVVLEADMEAAETGFVLEKDDLARFLGQPLFDFTLAREGAEAGIISTLGRTGSHGVIADLEIALIPDNRGNLILTGNLDNVFREIVLVAITHLRQEHARYRVPADFNEKLTIHLNMMPGGVLKSGVSAGLAVFLCLLSAITGQPIPGSLSAIGEISLKGRVKKVIGVHEKILAAYRLGVTTVVFPRENDFEIENLPAEVKRDMDLVSVDTVAEAVARVFGPGDTSETPA